MTPKPERRRIGALVLACAAGAATAAVGQWLGGSEQWWLALPLALAIGWWFVGTPQHCQPAEPGPSAAGREPGPHTPGAR